jgi:hypothetical protein
MARVGFSKLAVNVPTLGISCLKECSNELIPNNKCFFPRGRLILLLMYGALRGFSERETQAFQNKTKDYKYKNNININLKPKIIAKHLLANRLFKTQKYVK